MDDPAPTRTAGLLLAAGAGRRMGRPKALVRGDDGEPWVVRAARVLIDAGCSPVVVVLGAQGDDAAVLLEPVRWGAAEVCIVQEAGWESGVSASLVAGLRALDEGGAGCGQAGQSGVAQSGVAQSGVAQSVGARSGAVQSSAAQSGADEAAGVVVVPVDVPDLSVAAVVRVIGAAGTGGQASAALVQAVYRGAPGHPVFIGREHWRGVTETVRGDVGARPYLKAHGAALVECFDLGSGEDVDSLNM